VIGPDYDPMLAKVIAWGADRDTALRRIDAALADTVVIGVTTNIGFLRRLVADPDVAAGAIDTTLVERKLDDLAATRPPAVALVAAALLPLLHAAAESGDPWTDLIGWRLGGSAAVERRLEIAGERIDVAATRLDTDGHWSVATPMSDSPIDVSVDDHGGDRLVLMFDGEAHRVEYVRYPASTALVVGGENWNVGEAAVRPTAGAGGAGSSDGAVRSPMPGTLIAVHVAAGDPVIAGQPLAVVEAMKMEHTLTAPFDGTVAQLRASNGASVTLDEVVLVIDHAEEA
jgi:acetyl-CoA/propionyl-CoA carboxylase biotin carboxyl carrier protein